MAKAEQSDSAKFVIDQDDYELTVAAAKDLGLRETDDYLIHGYEAIKGTLGRHSKDYLNRLSKTSSPELTIHLPFIEEYSLTDLLGRFDRKQRYHTVVNEDPWSNYHKSSYNGRLLRPVLGVVINETVDPLGNYPNGINYHKEAGLVGLGSTPPEQRKLAGLVSMVGLDLMSVSQYVLMQAKRRIAGEAPLDCYTETCFPQLMGHRGDESLAPSIGWKYDRMEFGSVDVGYRGPDVGVRRVLNTDKQILAAAS